MADIKKIKLPSGSEYNLKDYRIPGVDTTPTSGSDNIVTSEGVYNSIKDFESFYFVQGSSSAAGNSTSGSYLSTKWEGTVPGVSTATNGLKIAYRIATNTGVSTAGVVLSIDGTNYYPVVIQKNTLVTSHYPVGTTVLMVFNSTQTATAYLTSNTKSTVTGCWQIMEYDSNSDTKQREYLSSDNVEYPITTRYATTSGSSYYAEYGRYSSGVTMNPSTNTITASSFKVSDGTSSQVLKADGSLGAIDSTPTANSSNLVTSGGVYQSVIDASLVTSAALNDLNTRLDTVQSDLNDIDLPGTLTTTATTALSTATNESLSGSINLHKVAKTGTYSDLIGKPTIPAAPGTLNTNNATAQMVSSSESLSGTINLHKIAKTGSYNDLLNKPPEGPLVVEVNYSQDQYDEMIGTIVSGTVAEIYEAYSNSRPVILRANVILDQYTTDTYYAQLTYSDSVYVENDQLVAGGFCFPVISKTSSEVLFNFVWSVNDEAQNPLTDPGISSLIPSDTASFYAKYVKTTYSGIDYEYKYVLCDGLIDPNMSAKYVLPTPNVTVPSDAKVIATTDQIPNAVTESTVSGWGFTKNTGTLTGVSFNGTAATVTNGVAAITAPQILSGTSDPSSSLGNNGDIYIKLSS